MFGFVGRFRQKWKGLCLTFSQVHEGIFCEPHGSREKEWTMTLTWVMWEKMVYCGCCWITKSSPTLCDPHRLQHARLPCPSLSLRVCSNSCPLGFWCHPAISSSVTPFSSCRQSFSASGSCPIRWLFASSDQSIGVSASVLPTNIQGWFPLGLTDLGSIIIPTI